MDRRIFLASVAASAAGSEPALAAQGGTPVRDKPLRTDNWGPLHYDSAEKAQVDEVVDTGVPFRFSGRRGVAPVKVSTYEKEFAAKIGARFALAVSSGTAALECAIAALQIGPGDEVIMPAWTWHSDCTAVVRAGALPVFAEIDETFNLDPADLEARITPHTKAIIAVHLQGNPAHLDPILAIAGKHKLRVIEDCSQAVGASYKGRRLGSMGDIATYSHQESKTITSGEGGTVVSSNPELFERAVRFHDVGNIFAPHKDMLGEVRLSPFVGTNFRMSEFSGGVMLAQLRKLDQILAAVRGNAERVYHGLADIPGLRFRQRPDAAGDLCSPVFVRFDTKAQRDRFLELMKAENVPANGPSGSVVLPIQPYIENKITVHPAWPSWQSERGKAIRYGAASCPRTIDILSRFAGVPVGPKYTRQDTDDIVAAVRKAYPAALRA
ncbi:DegT/DnrJ/EryC1/StrS family aminotransferase [Paludibaculum fermentans]|uniref:DegT/DnrJ/EryC1/StrS family aminotransferase n=1 Tax=Paludibaculum fermentans TaxID=1473598 RepID=A0A7S7SLX7_PALFE|nr:DegT/DnrJ/EryC1/StrS family aminotransferase [Paludibaculum fermentans]QOY88926.1 DegT/DnrJ/EryC1/StrS family aminotransferase [Paludibaculum fermentans]